MSEKPRLEASEDMDIEEKDVGAELAMLNSLETARSLATKRKADEAGRDIYVTLTAKVPIIM